MLKSLPALEPRSATIALDECQQIADVHIATDDGSLGFKGFVTEMLRARRKRCQRQELENSYALQLWPRTYGTRGGRGAAQALW